MKQNKEKEYSETDLLIAFGLTRQKAPYTALMTEWTDAKIALNTHEQAKLENLWQRAFEELESWQEEELKIKFIAPFYSTR